LSRKSFILFLAVGVLWGIPYLFMKVAVAEFAPVVIVFSRVLIGSALLIPLAIRRKTLNSALANLKFVIPYAIGEMIGPWILITTAEKKISSGLAGLLVATVPIWATILAANHGDKSAWHHKRLLGLVVGFAGVVLVVGLETFSQKQSFLSIIMIIIASIGYAWSTNMISRKIPHVDGVAINGVSMGITALFYLPFALARIPTHSPSLKASASVLALGFFSTAAAFIAFFIIMKDIGPARASLVTYLNTAIAVLLGVILLHEPLTLGIIIGLPLVLIGSYFASRKVRTIFP
jgi:drug/metabolite transporter (DMT)-like permease